MGLVASIVRASSVRQLRSCMLQVSWLGFSSALALWRLKAGREDLSCIDINSSRGYPSFGGSPSHVIAVIRCKVSRERSLHDAGYPYVEIRHGKPNARLADVPW